MASFVIGASSGCMEEPSGCVQALPGTSDPVNGRPERPFSAARFLLTVVLVRKPKRARAQRSENRVPLFCHGHIYNQ